jgi:hypothetical protein
LAKVPLPEVLVELASGRVPDTSQLPSYVQQDWWQSSPVNPIGPYLGSICGKWGRRHSPAAIDPAGSPSRSGPSGSPAGRPVAWLSWRSTATRSDQGRTSPGRTSKGRTSPGRYGDARFLLGTIRLIVILASAKRTNDYD